MMVVESKYNPKEIVFLLTDPLQQPRMVTELRIYTTGDIVYVLTSGTQHTLHREPEISRYPYELEQLRDNDE